MHWAVEDLLHGLLYQSRWCSELITAWNQPLKRAEKRVLDLQDVPARLERSPWEAAESWPLQPTGFGAFWTWCIYYLNCMDKRDSQAILFILKFFSELHVLIPWSYL